MGYSFLQPLLFQLEPELAHRLSLDALKNLDRIGCLPRSKLLLPCTVMGIDFPNPLGVAAGLDKNGDYINCLAALGFGFIEVGTVTPRPQAGNPAPRVFRVPEVQALINRLGFNNKGVDYCINQIKRANYSGILGINIGKNRDTPIENSILDYVFCLQRVYPWVNYVTINISSPNTPDLRNLQHGEYLNNLLSTLKKEQAKLAREHGCYVPLVLKIAPDLNQDQIEELADALIYHKIDGVIATNTTVSRDALVDALDKQHVPEGKKRHDYLLEAGGLSGRPLFESATRVLEHLSICLKNKIPIIGVGGILSGEDALKKTQAGAQLLQVYTGFIYRGPGLVKEIIEALKPVLKIDE